MKTRLFNILLLFFSFTYLFFGSGLPKALAALGLIMTIVVGPSLMNRSKHSIKGIIANYLVDQYRSFRYNQYTYAIVYVVIVANSILYTHAISDSFTAMLVITAGSLFVPFRKIVNFELSQTKIIIIMFCQIIATWYFAVLTIQGPLKYISDYWSLGLIIR